MNFPWQTRNARVADRIRRAGEEIERARLREARRRAQAAYDAACARRNTQDKRTTLARLQAATNALMLAEVRANG